jgi:hypothetical protein
MKSISFLLILTSLLFSTTSFSHYNDSYDDYDYYPETEEYESEYIPQESYGEEYAPGELEQQEHELYSGDDREWSLSDEEIPVEYYE